MSKLQDVIDLALQKLEDYYQSNSESLEYAIENNDPHDDISDIMYDVAYGLSPDELLRICNENISFFIYTPNETPDDITPRYCVVENVYDDLMVHGKDWWDDNKERLESELDDEAPF